MQKTIVTLLAVFISCTLSFGQQRILNIIAIGAHPDDCDSKFGGTAALFAKMGHNVKFLSLTSGDAGHQSQGGGALGNRRRAEAKEAGKRLGIAEYETLDNHDGELMPTLENRRKITRLIRQWNADIVISHRPWDYHPDHRYVGVLVQDAAYMVTVPFFLPSVPPLKKNPVFLYSSDRFQKPYPFEADIAVNVDSVFEKKVAALTALVSQTYEGGALGSAEKMQAAPPESQPQLRAQWLKERWVRRQSSEAKNYRDALLKWYGEAATDQIEYAEAFEICEYGRQPSDEEIRELFPFLPPKQ